VVAKTWKWRKRILHGLLGFEAEVWKWDVGVYEGTDAMRSRGLNDDEILIEVTKTLLWDVVDAAGGVLGAHERFTQSLALAQERYTQTAQEIDISEGTPEPNVRTFYGDVLLEDAWYSLEEMIVWARTLDERLKRRTFDRRRYQGLIPALRHRGLIPALAQRLKRRTFGRRPRYQGLIPALADGPRRQVVINARARLLNDHSMKEAKSFANMSLHTHSTEPGTKGQAEVRGGQLVLRFPDRPTQPVSYRWQLTYNEDREARSYADGLIRVVERFMDELLTAFEEHPREEEVSPLSSSKRGSETGAAQRDMFGSAPRWPGHCLARKDRSPGSPAIDPSGQRRAQKGVPSDVHAAVDPDLA
jgi:hypothetical protein